MKHLTFFKITVTDYYEKILNKDIERKKSNLKCTYDKIGNKKIGKEILKQVILITYF